MNSSISRALNFRFEELCSKYVPNMNRKIFGATVEIVGYIHKELSSENQTELAVNFLAKYSSSNGWMENEGDFFSALMELVRGKILPVHFAKMEEQPRRFLEIFDSSHKSSLPRFKLLVSRYNCPINILLPSEEEIREYLLYRTMVPDRAKLDKSSLSELDHDELLLRLNLIAVYAMASGDLRYLDALNYYYERLPANWIPQGRFPWLFGSYIGLYARVLAIWANEGEICG